MMNLTEDQQKLALEYAVAFIELELEKLESRVHSTWGEPDTMLKSRIKELYRQLEVFQDAIV